MKLVKLLCLVMLFAALNLQAQQYSFTNHANTVILDDNPTGLLTTIDVSGVAGWITNVSVFLNVSGGANGDYYSYLSGDNGGFAVLLNRVGKTGSNPFGYGDAGLSITLNDLAGTDVHGYGGNSGNPLAGTWQPDGRNVNPQYVLETDFRTSLLGQFNTRSANGAWTLFISDQAGGIQGTLVEWSLTFETVPEPTILSLAVFGGGLLALACWRHRRTRLS